MALTKAKVSFLEGVDGAVLTGAMPAVDGASLTGVSGMTKETSDPLITTNPATGVGTVWLNKSTSDLFGCTDATANANVWVNIGGGFGNYGKSFGGNGPGTIAGFTAGGQPGGGNVIEKFTFGSANNAVDHGDLSTASRTKCSGCSSATHGYVAGGGDAPTDEIIDKFAFASNTTATRHGSLLVPCLYSRAGAASSVTHGYVAGGESTVGPATPTNRIEKFSFGTDATSSDHGDLAFTRSTTGGHSSDTHGFCSNGSAASPSLVINIDKYPFSSESNAVDHGDLVLARYGGEGCSSTTDGYVGGGHIGASRTDSIDKFAFSSNTTAADHGNLTVGRAACMGQSSTTHGYISGGYTPPNLKTIDKFPYASNSGATDHGDLATEKSWGAGTQY